MFSVHVGQYCLRGGPLEAWSADSAPFPQVPGPRPCGSHSQDGLAFGEVCPQPGEGNLQLGGQWDAHTVKPPDPIAEDSAPAKEKVAPVWFKRKSRMVICGNFIE